MYVVHKKVLKTVNNYTTSPHFDTFGIILNPKADKQSTHTHTSSLSCASESDNSALEYFPHHLLA